MASTHARRTRAAHGAPPALTRPPARQAFLEENVTFSAKSIKAEQHIQVVPRVRCGARARRRAGSLCREPPGPGAACLRAHGALTCRDCAWWVQKVLNLVKKTTFWEFRVDYLAELGAALHNARYVEVLSVDQAVISDAIAFMSVCSCQAFPCFARMDVRTR